MSSGLTFNDDVVVTVNDAVVAPGATTYTDESTDSGDTFTLTFDNDYVKGLADDTVITITYSATVNSDALETDEENNTAKLTYGDKTAQNSTPEEEVKVYDATIKVYKYTTTEASGTDAEKPLAGAGFVLKNSAGKYYKLDNGVVTWVDSINDATEYLTDDTGALANGASFTGLASGTYALEEKTVPAGYNKAPDTPVTIAANNYDAGNLEQTIEVENESGTTLPSTGGIGTTIFYIIGASLVIVAAVVLIAKRRTKVNTVA